MDRPVADPVSGDPLLLVGAEFGPLRRTPRSCGSPKSIPIFGVILPGPGALFVAGPLIFFDALLSQARLVLVSPRPLLRVAPRPGQIQIIVQRFFACRRAMKLTTFVFEVGVGFGGGGGLHGAALSVR